jgi:tRNA-specific adenosine deaminase 2
MALKTDETPVGCVLVHENKIVARGMNATNRTLNGTRHAEFMAISSLLTGTGSQKPGEPARAFVQSDLRGMILYVTIEPCVMCASLLRQYGIKKVYFGAANERFGGTGGVFRINDCAGEERGYEVSGGWLREEAILLLRRFYVQENEKGEFSSILY